MKGTELLEIEIRRASCYFNIFWAGWIFSFILVLYAGNSGISGLMDIELILIGGVAGGLPLSIIFLFRRIKCPFCNEPLETESMVFHNLRLWNRWPGVTYNGPLKQSQCNYCKARFDQEISIIGDNQN